MGVGEAICSMPEVVVPCRNFLKYAAHWGAHGNACCCDYTDDVGEELVAVCRRIIRVEGKRPGIVAVSLDVVRAVSFGGECHFQNSTIESSVYPM
jgi:hypothetical protein